MKNYLIEECGQYKIKINVDAENEEEATVLKKVNEIKDHMIENDIGSLDKIDLNKKIVYFKSYRHTPKQAIIPYTKAFKKIGWILYVRW